MSLTASIDYSHDVEDVALAALLKLSRGVAVIGHDDRLLLKNPGFDALFGAGLTGPAVLSMIGLRARPAEDSGPFQVLLDDGRTASVEVARVPQGWLITAEDVSAALVERERAAGEARVDILTGLGNRLMFQEAMNAALDGKDTRFAVLMLDLDRFKAVNDGLGHPVGDALLVKIAQRLRGALSPDDVAARLGGDEFGVIQVGQSQPQAAAALAERLVDLLGRAYIVDGHLINIGASVGVALAPEDGGSYAEIVRSADLALYRAKQGGRSTFRFFESAMDEQMQARRRLEIDLRRALALREFTLFYQPQFNLASRKVTGFEALLRWRSESRGMVPPAEFIPLAEEIGLISPIGEWVIRTACREAAGWADNLSVAVNVSAVQFRSRTLLSTIVSALAESGLAPNRLELEITESVLLEDLGAATSLLNSVREMGVRVSMDDFGTGYSSLSYLRSFPFDKIKIDQSFVRAGDQDPGAAAIVRAIAALGQSLGMTVTAEGVETDDQFANVLAVGCTDVQGYAISRPMPADQIAAFLTSSPRDA
ncbi:putative bifunctional diguanylate cyclase/phosphodiesterase [Hansschlegelia quercus]|uniref:EAL domain-containing protein n=1 Tax=Hansschlegelia quercus TaxID=2528245 RepID=A0A4Q9GP07_9HYPH|nr:EAL domain-containing protein [Hansschlegelia quercus]TBN54925.1 EAL domain-containing protein [Hansschlegelia quercus]